VDLAIFKVRQMRRLGPIVIATVAILTAGADAQVHDPPLFAAFKAFCIDTGASPDSVKSAVEAAGGKQLGPSGAIVESPWPMTVTTWDVTTGGHSMWASAGTQQAPPLRGRPEENSNHCTISSFVNEDASIEAIRNWVGVTPVYFSRDNRIHYFFHYQELGSPIVGIVSPHYRAVRSTLPADKTAYDWAKVEGRIWSLAVTRFQDGASVDLAHHLAPPIPR
jgi:hypothetical protein